MRSPPDFEDVKKEAERAGEELDRPKAAMDLVKEWWAPNNPTTANHYEPGPCAPVFVSATFSMQVDRETQSLRLTISFHGMSGGAEVYRFGVPMRTERTHNPLFLQLLSNQPAYPLCQSSPVCTLQ